MVVLDPAVNWFIISSGRASASVTQTLSTGRSSSSAMIIAVDVVMPWPVSTRGSSNDAVPFLWISTVIMSAVGLVESVSRSLRAEVSAMPGAYLIGWGSAPLAPAGLAQRAAATTVGAAITYARKRRLL